MDIIAGRRWICKSMGIVFLLLCLTACSGEPVTNPEAQEPGYESTIYRVDLQDKVAFNTFLCGEELVYETRPMVMGGFGRSEYYSLSVLEPDAAPEKLEFQFSADWGTVYDMKKDADGNYYILETDTDFVASVSDEGAVRNGCCVYVYDAEGGLLNKWGISQWLLEAGNQLQVQELALDDQRNIYVRGFDTLLLMNSAGQYQGCISEISYHMTCGADGQIYYVSRAQGSDYQLKKVDFKTASSEAVCSGFPVGEGMFPGEDKEPWVFSQNGIYRRVDAMPEQIFSWLEADVDGTMIQDAELLSDGRFLAVISADPLDNWRVKTLEEAQPLELAYIVKGQERASRKETITVAVKSISADMLASTIQYNREHPDYRVVLKEYAGIDGYQNREDAVAALDMDLVSGGKLDIIFVDYFDLEKYVSKGLLEDLGTYLDNGEGLHREDLVESVADAYTFNGKLVALPTWFRLDTILGMRSMLGDRDSWSIADMAAFYERHQDWRVWQSASPQDMLEICMKFNQTFFVDWEKGSCDFDREEFYQLLEFAGRFSGEDGAYNRDWGIIRQEDEQALLGIERCMTPNFTSEMPQWFSGEEINYIGYPVLDGKPGILLETSADSYGILSNSSHKEQAWDYLEYVIQAKGDSDGSFSILQDKLDQMLEASMADPYTTDAAGNPIRRVLTKSNYSGTDTEILSYVPLPEEIEQVRELIRLARPAPGYHEIVMNIILEEAAGYFAGDRDAEDVAATIQNRVQLYLEEQK